MISEIESKNLPLPLEFAEFPSQMEQFEIYFDCNDNKFITRDMICDGREDCMNGADEDACDTNHISSVAAASVH